MNKKTQIFFLKHFGFSEKFLKQLKSENLIEETFFGNLKCASPQELNLIKQYDRFQKFQDVARKHFKDSGERIFYGLENNDLTRIFPNTPPLFTYYKGNTSLLADKHRVAVIGTRNPTQEYLEKGKRLVQQYVNKGSIIVSGLAIGIDTMAHVETLRHNGKTIAVLPSSLKNVYPKCNKSLADEINQKGLLLSRTAFNEDMKRWMPIARNKIVAGISDEVLVIECSLKSGTMNTVQVASETGKKIRFLKQVCEETNAKLIELGGTMIEE